MKRAFLYGETSPLWGERSNAEGINKLGMYRAINIVRTFILVIIILLGGEYCVFAQNTGASPYLDSEHAYQVKVGKATNTKKWVITDKLATPIEITLNDALLYAEITDATTDGANEIITIYFDHTVFTHTGLWYLQYFEYNGGSTNCVSSREFPINIVENTFYLSLPADGFVCNDQSNSVHTFSEVTSTSYPTIVTYTVTMHKESSFAPSQWYFKAQFDQPAVAASFSASIAATDGVVTSTESAGVYTVTVVPVGNTQTSVPITIKASFNHAINSANTPRLTVSGGKAVVNGTPPAITDDNLVPSSDREQMITVRAVPETNDILPGDNETVATAQNPMQNSTHKYKVAMGDYNGNYTNASWYVENPLNPGVAITTGLTITRSLQSGSTSTDTVSVAFTTLTTGNYILYFKEVNGNGCSTVRAYPFTLVGPFVVTLAENFGNNCATVSGDVNNTPTTATTTEVVYTVSLPSAYYADWNFNFAVSSAPAFTADMEVQSIVVAPAAGLTVTSPTSTSRVVKVPSSVSSVTLTVTYSGLYQNEHIITALLSSITGSYNETVTDVSISRTIYAMPQAGILAGVD